MKVYLVWSDDRDYDSGSHEVVCVVNSEELAKQKIEECIDDYIKNVKSQNKIDDEMGKWQALNPYPVYPVKEPYRHSYPTFQAHQKDLQPWLVEKRKWEAIHVQPHNDMFFKELLEVQKRVRAAYVVTKSDRKWFEKETMIFNYHEEEVLEK